MSRGSLTSLVASTMAAALASSRKKTPSWDTRQWVWIAAVARATAAAATTASTYARVSGGSDHRGQCRSDAPASGRRQLRVPVALIRPAACRKSLPYTSSNTRYERKSL